MATIFAAHSAQYGDDVVWIIPTSALDGIPTHARYVRAEAEVELPASELAHHATIEIPSSTAQEILGGMGIDIPHNAPPEPAQFPSGERSQAVPPARSVTSQRRPRGVPRPVELAVEHVESAQEGSAVCGVRRLSGVVEPGALVLADADAGTPAPDGTLRIDWIKRYERPVDILDPPHNARVHLSGRSASPVRHGTRSRSTAAR